MNDAKYIGLDDEMDRFGIACERDVFRRRLVRVQPIRMRVVDSEDFEPPLAEFPHQAHDLLRRNLVIPDRISRNVLGRNACVISPFCPARMGSIPDAAGGGHAPEVARILYGGFG
jgi:hypothetical protein